MSNTNTQPSEKPKRRSRKRFNKFMKLMRRIHMYLGLLLVPWVIMFGMSGFLFNHVSTFWGGSLETVATLDSSTVQSSTSFEAFEPEVIAQSIVEQINTETGETFTLKSSWLTGHLRLSGKSGKKNLNLAVNLSDGSTKVTTSNRSTPEQDKPIFDKQKINLPETDTTALVEELKPLLAEQGVTIDGELKPPARGANAEIRFVVTDNNGRDWRASYNLVKGTLTGVADDSDTGYTFYSAITRLHKTHVYPDTVGAKWLWTLIGDTMAISMVVWGITGLIMWWQIQPTRVLGMIAIFIASIVAIFIFSGTLADYTHNPVQTRRGFGPPPAQQAKPTPNQPNATRQEAPQGESRQTREKQN